MSKEQLKQVVDLQAEYYSTWDKKHSDKIANDLMRNHSDWLIEQTERVQELENILDQDHRQEVLESMYEQNKQYRKLLNNILALNAHVDYIETELYEKTLELINQHLGLGGNLDE